MLTFESDEALARAVHRAMNVVLSKERVALWPCRDKWQAEIPDPDSVWVPGSGNFVATGDTPLDAIDRCLGLRNQAL